MVMQGYKQTEVGTIPENWDVISINGNFDFYQNNTYARDCMNDMDGTINNIHYGDVLIKFGAILDCDKNRIPFLNADIAINLVKHTIQSGDIIIADTAEDNTVGKATEVQNVKDKKIVSGLHTIFIRPHAGLFTARFLGYFWNAPVYHNQLLPYIVGTKVSSISKKSLLETKLLHPPLPEQTAIATALSDMDNLIEATEKLIAKKKAIKQGTMQELLTGKRRLDGFSEEWVKCPLKKYIKDFIVPMRNKPKELGGQIPWCRIEDFEGIYLCGSKSGQGVSENTIQIMNLKVFPINTLLVSCSANLGKCAITSIPLITNQTFIGLVPRNNCDVLYLYYAMIWRGQELNELSSGTTISYLSREQFEIYEIEFPSYNEQKAISSILLAIDTEIMQLEKKLSKYSQIKQGMMSELLSGRIRLLDEEVS